MSSLGLVKVLAVIEGGQHVANQEKQGLLYLRNSVTLYPKVIFSNVLKMKQCFAFVEKANKKSSLSTI